MSGNIALLPATLEQLEDLVFLERCCFSVPWSRDAFRSALDSPPVFFLLAYQEENPVGYIGVQRLLEEGDILSFAVHPDYRRRGYGKILLQAALCQLAQEKVERVFLEVRQSNLPAQAAYAAEGFEPIGTRKNYYESPTEDAVLMRKELLP